MITITGIYEDQLHCNLTHGPSQKSIETDAPKDNNGKGEAFSPTDLLAAALASCMMTVMGIFAQKNGISLNGAHFKIEKHMKSSPRMVERLNLELYLPKEISMANRALLENTALNCPVKLSLHSDILVDTKFLYMV